MGATPPQPTPSKPAPQPAPQPNTHLPSSKRYHEQNTVYLTHLIIIISQQHASQGR